MSLIYLVRLFLLSAISFFSLVLNAQNADSPILVGDTCYGNFTSYTRISNSVYKVITYNQNIVCFEGYIKSPVTFQMLNLNKESLLNNVYFNDKLDSICILNDTKGNRLLDMYFRNGYIISKHIYNKNKLVSSFETINGIEISRSFDQYGNILEKQVYNPYKHTFELKNKEQHTKYRIENNSREKVSVIGNKIVKRFNGKVTLKDIYYKNSMQIKSHTIYMNGKKYSYSEYDRSGHMTLSEEYFESKLQKAESIKWDIESPGKRFRITATSLFPVKKLYWTYESDKLNGIVNYQIDSNLYKFFVRDDSVNIVYTRLGCPDIKITLIKYGDSYRQLIQFADFTIKKHMSTMDNFIDENLFKGPEFIWQYFTFMPNYKLDTTTTINIIYNDYWMFRSEAKFQIDSIYKNKNLISIVERVKDTSSYYTFENGKKVLIYCNQYLHEAKDQESCGMGLKKLNGEWLNSFRYADLSSFYISRFDLIHLAESSGYVTIYNWKGDILMPAKKGVRYNLYDSYGDDGPFYIDQTIVDSLKLYSNCLVWIDNTEDSLFGFLDIKGNFIFRSKTRIIPKSINYYNRELSWWLHISNEKYGYGDFKGNYLKPNYTIVNKIGHDQLILGDSTGFWLSHLDGEPYFNEHFENFNYDNERLLISFINYNKNIKVYAIESMELIFDSKNDSFSDWGEFYFIHNTTTNKCGILDKNYTIAIPEDYTEITQIDNYTIRCKKENYFDFYDINFKLVNHIRADSIINISNSHYLNYDYFDNWNYNYYGYNHSEFLLDGKKGMISKSGKIEVPAKYELILVDQFYNYYGFTGKDYDLFIYDKNLDSWLYSKDKTLDSYRQLNSVHNNYIRYLVNANGQIVEEDIDEIGSIGYGNISIKKNGRIIGMANFKGEWLKMLSEISEIQDNNGYYIYKNTKGKAGVFNCRMETVFPPDAEFISQIIKNRFIWYNIPLSSYTNFYYYEQTRNIWQLKDIKTGKTLKDTFYQPVLINKPFNIVRNNHDMLAIMDSNLNFLRPFTYTHYIDNYYFNKLFFKLQGQGYDVFDKDYNFIRHLDFVSIKSLKDQHYIGMRNGFTFILDSSLNILDSSDCLFANRKNSIIQWSYYDSILMYKLYNNIDRYVKQDYEGDGEYFHFDEAKNAENIRKTPMSCEYMNFLRLIQILEETNEFNDVKTFNVFFIPPVESYRTNNDWSARNFNMMPFPWENTDSTFKKTLNYNDFLNQKRTYIPVSYYKQFGSLSQNKYNSSYIPEYNNYFFSKDGAVFVSLSDLIKPDKISEFNKLFKKNLKVIDDPESPCWQIQNPFETYGSSFSISFKGLTFYLDTQYKITISFDELNEYLNPEWRELL